MNQSKWINVARVCYAARMLTPAVLSRWSDCPKRLSDNCDKLIAAGELAASMGLADDVDSNLLESMTMLVGVLHLRSQGYEGVIPELWDDNIDIRDALPASPGLQMAIRNWVDTACRCSRTAVETTLDGAATESQAGLSWTCRTLEELSEAVALNDLRSSLTALDGVLQHHTNTKNATCSYVDGRWVVRLPKPWYRRWFT